MGFGKGKSTKLALHERRNEVMTCLLDGWRTNQIVDHFKDEYGISKSQVEKDITWCYQEFKENNSIDVATLVDVHIARYEEMYKKLNEQYDQVNAAKMLQYKEKLLGLHKPDVVVQNNTQVNNINFGEKPTEDLIKIINASK
jgi:hypothetical protein